MGMVSGVDVLDVIAVVIGFVFGVIAVRARMYQAVKLKLIRVEHVICALVDLMKEVNESLKDDKLTKEEVERIVDRLMKLATELRGLIK